MLNLKKKKRVNTLYMLKEKKEDVQTCKKRNYQFTVLTRFV
jgi:hypothetical protein